VPELKILRKTLELTLQERLDQTTDYMDKCGTAEGYLLIFDRTPGKRWEEKIWVRTETYFGKEIRVWGC